MTTNSYIFAWDQLGIESIIPITKYENIDRDNTMRILADQPPIPNNLGQIISTLKLRARFNPERHYEIYAIDCDFDIDEEGWRKIWEENPQGTADLIRERGHKIHSDREDRSRRVII